MSALMERSACFRNISVLCYLSFSVIRSHVVCLLSDAVIFVLIRLIFLYWFLDVI